MRPEISVIIPVYNKESFVSACISSVLGQTFAGFELILVNDGSTDGSLAAIKQFTDPRIKILEQPNQGLSAARNTGIAAATGKIIALIDADDLWLPEHLDRIYRLYLDFPEAALYGTAYAEIYPDGKTLEPIVNYLPMPKEPVLVDDFFKRNMYQPLMNMSCFAFKPEVIQRIGGFDTRITYSEDVDFFIRANLKFKTAYDPRVSSHVTMISENQITAGKRSEKRPPDFQKFLDEYPQHKSLMLYINLKRYFLCIFYKMERATEKFQTVLAQLDQRLLSHKQRFLLKSPVWVIQSLRRLKMKLLRSGKRVTTF